MTMQSKIALRIQREDSLNGSRMGSVIISVQEAKQLLEECGQPNADIRKVIKYGGVKLSLAELLPDDYAERWKFKEDEEDIWEQIKRAGPVTGTFDGVEHVNGRCVVHPMSEDEHRAYVSDPGWKSVYHPGMTYEDILKKLREDAERGGFPIGGVDFSRGRDKTVWSTRYKGAPIRPDTSPYPTSDDILKDFFTGDPGSMDSIYYHSLEKLVRAGVLSREIFEKMVNKHG